MDSTLSTEQKALAINLDNSLFGTFAEIGAGQETARYFFKVGGAAGTIAKSMSAYDMTFSDEIYGKVGRYVSKERLEKMLDHEYALLLQRLSEKRGAETSFFVFANTVSARNFKGTNECHGWLGVRFQSAPVGPASDIIIHVRMADKENLLQQQALGVIGVNLLYGAFFLRSKPKEFIMSLLDGLNSERIEVDMIEFRGPAFAGVDNRLMSLFLLQCKLTNAVMFRPDGAVIQPSEVLYKKNILVERGSFRPVTHVNLDMIKGAKAQFLKDQTDGATPPLVLFEITLNNLLASGGLDEADFLARSDCLCALGYTVLISNYPEYYRLSKFFRRYTKEMVGMVLGINALLEIFNEKFYADLEGGVLESLGRLFTNRARLYVYPMTREAYLKYIDATQLAVRPANINGLPEVINVKDVELHGSMMDLYRYLINSGMVVAIHEFNANNFGIFSRDVLKKIKDGDLTWKEAVPAAAALLIEQRKMFR